ncbi:MAG: hypothetical protein IPM79_14740 [Polyangiaceae bacterium]|nr:hypothetical protein [Polyangiaceae bacterium]
MTNNPRARLGRRSLGGLGAALLLSLAACPSEGTQVPVVESPPKVVTAKPVEAEPAIELTPVPAPNNLMFVLRAPRPHDTLAALQKLGKLPVSLEDVLSDASKGASRFLDLKESFDLAVAIDPATVELDEPKFFVGFSVPVARDKFEGLLGIIEKHGDTVRKAGPGRFRIQSREMTCELLMPEGAQSRLVCGDSITAYRELGPWLYRTLATQARPANDVQVRLELAPLRDELLPMLKSDLDEALGSTRKGLSSLGVNDAELLDAPAGLAKELTLFLEELDRFEASATINPSKPDAVMKGELFFRGNQAWATKALTGGNGPAAPAPDAFWRLPKEADTALFGFSGDPKLFDPIRRVGKKAIATGLTFAQIDKADSDAIVALLDGLPVTKGLWTFASGELPAGKPVVVAKPAAFTPDNAVAELKNRVRSLVGWSVWTAEGDPAQATAFLKQLADVAARGTKIVKKKADDEVQRSSGDSKKWALERRKKLDTTLPKVKLVNNVPGLPKGSVALDIEFPFGSKNVWSEMHPIKEFDKRPSHPANEVRGNIMIRFVVAPDEGGRYAMGLSSDADGLKQKVLASLKSDKPEEQLSSRTDLARLKSPVRSGGFFAVGQRLRGIAKLDEKDRDMRQLLELTEALPNKLSGPIFFAGGGASGGTPSLSMEMILDKAWIEDITAGIGLMVRRGK